MSTKERSSADYRGGVESPFLDEDLFVGESEEEWGPRVAALAAESPFRSIFEPFEKEIIDKDERTLVTDTLKIPNRWICAIDILIDNPKWGSHGEPKFISKSRATGILIGPRYVLTAGHVLGKQTIEVDGEKKSVDVKGLTISPARNGYNSRSPFGTVNSKVIRVSTPYQLRLKITQGSRAGEIKTIPQRDDYALIILEKDLSSSTHSKMKGVLGYWGHNPTMAVIRRLEPGNIKGKEIVVIGYPGDTCGKDKFSGSKSEKEKKIANCWNRRNDEWASTQWRSMGTLEVEENSTTMFHTADTYEGQSGAPICLTVDQKLHLVGIHTSSHDPKQNKGVRVTRRMLWELCAWMNKDAGFTLATVKDDTLVVQPKSTAGAGAREFLDESEFAGAVEEEDGDELVDEFGPSGYFEPEAPEGGYSLEEVLHGLDQEAQLEEELDLEADWEAEAFDEDEFAEPDDETLLESDESEVGELSLEEETARGLAKKLKYLSLLPHSVEVGGKDVALTPGVMDPGIYDGPEKYKIAPTLQECLMAVMNTSKFRHIKVGLVDLTKGVLKPEFAGFNHKSQVFAASVPKIAAMLAAFQLCHDLRAALKQKGTQTLDELFALVRDDWAATQAYTKDEAIPFTFGVSLKGKLVLVQGDKIALGEPKAPQLENVFAAVTPANPLTIEFKSTGENYDQLVAIIDDFNKGKKGAKGKLDALGFLERMRIMIGGRVPVSNYATSTIVRDVGFLYIASTLLQSGLYDTNRKGGLWLGGNYWHRKWRGPLVGGAVQSATAGSLAAFMTLLAQNRLVSHQASTKMAALMKKEPNPTHPGIVSWFNEGLKGLKDGGSLIRVLSKLGVASGVDDCTFIEREVDLGKSKKVLRYVAVGLRANSSKELKALILELDRCILANNGLTPAHGGHVEIKASKEEPEFYEEEAGESLEETLEGGFSGALDESESERLDMDEEFDEAALDEQFAESELEAEPDYKGYEAPSEPYLLEEEETSTRYEREFSVLSLGETSAPQQEIILVAGANYPAFKQAGSLWKRSRPLSAGPWRQFCLRLAVHRLKQDPTLKVTLFDFLLGTREDVRLNANQKTTTTIEHSFVAPITDDYWNLVGFNPDNPSSALTALIEPAGKKTSFKIKPMVNYFDGATSQSPQGKSIKILNYVNAASKVTQPVISISDVYAYIEGFAGAGKKDALRELHFFAHAFNIERGRISGGPILLNSLDMNPLQADRHPLDKDCRASKDFQKPTMDPAKFAQAFAAEAKSFVWGCNFQRGFIRQFVDQVGKNAKTLAASGVMKISFSSDWDKESEFRTRLGLSSSASVKNVSVDRQKVEAILRDASRLTYMQKLATASGHPVVGGSPGTYADYDSNKSPFVLMHIPMSKDPFRTTDDSFERVLLFLKDQIGFKFDTTFGDHRGLGRGYMIYEP